MSMMDFHALSEQDQRDVRAIILGPCLVCGSAQCLSFEHCDEAERMSVTKNYDRKKTYRLTDEQVRKIHWDPRSARQIARDYGVSQPTVTKIKNFTSYEKLYRGERCEYV